MKHPIAILAALLLLAAGPAAAAGNPANDPLVREYTRRCHATFKEPDRLEHCLQTQKRGLGAVRGYMNRYINGRPHNPKDPYQRIFKMCISRSTLNADGNWPKLAYCIEDNLFDYLEMMQRGR